VNTANAYWAIKRSQLIFICVFVRNELILTLFSVSYLEVNDTDHSVTLLVIFDEVSDKTKYLQCFDAVGWVAGRASGL